ncbi:MAG: DUF4200 domain-containing protein [Candidatus Rokuibacteriota bacterium]
MRARIVVCLLLSLAVVPAAAAAQEAETLRRELEQMRKQFETMKQEYQKAMDTMTERLQRLEERPQAAPPAAAPVLVQTPPGPESSPPTIGEYLQPRLPFSLAERTGGGRLLFDIGVVADFIGNLTPNNVDRGDAGTFTGRENRFFPREVELSLFGQIDPYARGEVRIEAAEEFEDGERELHLGLAEAHLTLLTLPFGTQAKLGLVRNRFGLLNQLHREALPQPDQPNVLTRFFGEEGLNESGMEITWVPPLPFYLELLGGVFNGDNDTAFGRASLRDPLITGRARTFFELGDFGAVQLGTSVASGSTEEHLDQLFVGVDAKYKYVPAGWRHPLFTLAGEGIWSFRKVNTETEIDVDTDGDGVADATATIVEREDRDRFGWYAYAEVQPWPRWLVGVRYDSTQLLADPGREWAIGPYIAFKPSEFLRFRLGYKHTERDRSEGFTFNDVSARVANELFFQATFILGAHPAHPF